MFISLSPIIPTTCVKKNLNSHQNIFQQNLIVDDNILLVNIFIDIKNNYELILKLFIFK